MWKNTTESTSSASVVPCLADHFPTRASTSTRASAFRNCGERPMGFGCRSTRASHFRNSGERERSA
jgi:hypothetical protein